MRSGIRRAFAVGVILFAMFGAWTIIWAAIHKDQVAVWNECEPERLAIDRSCISAVIGSKSGRTTSAPCSTTFEGVSIGVQCVPRKTLQWISGEAIRVTIPPGATRVRVEYFVGNYDSTTMRGTKKVKNTVSARKLSDDAMERGSRYFEISAPASSTARQYAEITVWNGNSLSATFALTYTVDGTHE